MRNINRNIKVCIVAIICLLLAAQGVVYMPVEAADIANNGSSVVNTSVVNSSIAQQTLASTSGASSTSANAITDVNGIAVAPALTAKNVHGVPAPVTTESVLPNGLRVVFLEDHSFPIVSCLTWYHVGSRNEAVGSTGISHLLEHLLFGKVGTFRKGEIGTTIARVGGEFNGYTSDDFTAFFETLPAAKLELALRIESQRMRGGTFTDAEVQEEIVNIQTEFENESRDGLATLSREVRAALYQQHPYHNPTLGWRGDVENITSQQVKNYYDKYFWPNNCTLVIAGDFQPKQTLAQIQKYFGIVATSPAPIPNNKFVEPAQRGERRLIVRYPGRQEVLGVAYHGPAFDDADAPAMVVLEKLLNAPNAGRLKTKLVDQKACSSALASFEAKRDPGFFNINCLSIPGTANAQQKILDSLDSVLAQLRTQPVSDVEMKRARNQAEFAFYTEQEGPYRAGFHLGYFDSLSRWQNAYTWADRVRAVTANDVLRVSKRYLNPDNRVVAWLAGATAPKTAPAKQTDPQSPSPKLTPGGKFEHTRLTGYKLDDSSISPNPQEARTWLAQVAQATEPLKGTVKTETSTPPEPSKIEPTPARNTERSVKNAIKEIPSALPAAIKDIPSAIGGAPGAIKDLPAAVGAVPSIIKGIPSAVGGLPSAIREIPSAIGSIPSAIKQIPGAIGGIPGAAVGAVRDLPGAIGGLPGTAASTIKELPGAIGGIPGAAVGALKGMPGAIGNLAVELGGLPGALGKQLSGSAHADPLAQRAVKKVLKNGVTLIVFESHVSPVIQIEGAVRAGSVYEPVGKKGLSAVTAALLNSGTSHRSHTQIATQQEDLGLLPPNMLHFDDGSDTIEFRTRCLARDLQNQLELIGESFSAPALADSDIDRAKQDVLAELRQKEDSPDRRANRALVRSLLSTGSAYVPLDPSDVNRSMPNISALDGRKFFKDFVVPGAATIVLAGDIDPDVAAQIAERALGAWNGKGAHQRVHAHASQKHVLRTAIPTKDKTKTTICFGQLVPVAKTGPEYGSLLIADGVFSSHPIISRLGQKLVSEPVLSRALGDQQIDTHIEPVSNSVAWSFTVSVEPNAVPITVQSLQNELKQFARSGVTADEVFEAKRYLLGAIPVRSFSTIGATAKTLLDASVHTEEGENYWSVLNSLRVANLETVNRVIKSALKPDQTTMVIVGSPQSIRSIRNQVASDGVDHQLLKPAKTPENKPSHDSADKRLSGDSLDSSRP